MSELHFPWLEAAVFLPLFGALWVGRIRDPEQARRHALVVCGLTLIAAIGGWLDFGTLHTFEAHDRWDVSAQVSGRGLLVVDELSAPLIPLAALLYMLTVLSTLRTKVRRFSFAWTLFSESVLLGTLCSKEPWVVVACLSLATIPPFIELRARKRPTRVYVIHMALFVALLIVGCALIDWEHLQGKQSIFAVSLLMAAALLRSGVVPVHCWMTDLFEHATFGTALLFVTPMPGAYAAVRLMLPIAPEWALRSIAIISLITAVYAAGMALVQREARRFFCYLFLSHSALVLVGLEMATPIGLTGGLCVWLSVGLSLAGFGLTLRSLEARTGRISLDSFHGLYDHMPMRGAFFLLTGLASVGFPGTIGFIGAELLVDGAIDVNPYVGMAVVIAAALNGIAVLQAYFRLFTGTRRTTSISLAVRLPERLAILVLALLILGGGLVPSPGIASRYHAAMALIKSRQSIFPGAGSSPTEHPVSHDASLVLRQGSALVLPESEAAIVSSTVSTQSPIPLISGVSSNE